MPFPNRPELSLEKMDTCELVQMVNVNPKMQDDYFG